MKMIRDAHPWSVPIRMEDVPEIGRHVSLVADEQARTSVSAAAGVDAIERFEAEFDITPHGRDRLHVVGGISAIVRQTCVVTLEPITNDVTESIDVIFAPGTEPTSGRHEVAIDATDPPERIVNGRIDLGALATEFLILGIDPYPRQAGAVFDDQPEQEVRATAFAALSALKK
jgi:Large ribosomal RNA subunit accumulation protein YceD